MKNKNLLTFIVLFLFCSNVFGQVNANFLFHDSCGDTLAILPYDMWDMSSDISIENIAYSDNDSIFLQNFGTYMLTVHILRKELICMYSVNVEIEANNHSDTLVIPEILFCSDQALHSSYWTYQKCSQQCNGIMTDYYPNGNKRVTGNFIDGKPIEISFYRENGTLKEKEYYKTGYLVIVKGENYNESEELVDYYEYKHKKNKTITYHFDSEGELLEKFDSKY